MISTAKEFLDKSEIFETIKLRQNIVKQPTFLYDDVQKTMIEFAKLHVEAALKEVLNNTENWDDCKVIPFDKVLNSYPLTNIK